MKCVLAGTRCHQLHVVDVPWQIGVVVPTAPTDVDFLVWIPPLASSYQGLVDLSTTHVDVRNFEDDDGQNVLLDHFFTFFAVPQVRYFV